jgi:hypothetical protein
MTEIAKIALITFMFCALGQKRMIFNWYQRLIKPLPWYLSRPLGGCYKCLTGEICFWYLILTMQFIDYKDIIELLFLTSFGIMVSVVYNKIYCLLK